MNAGAANKMMIRHQIQLQGMVGGHAEHDNQLCDYADAAARDMYEQVVQELPTLVEGVMTKYLKENPYQLEVDKKSLANVKTQITNLLKSIFN